jgi:NitT/TauT family transport system substrate-binding protein
MLASKTRIHLPLLLAVLSILPAPEAARAGEPPGGRERVRVIIAPLLSYAPLWIAQEEGFFEEEGLDVEIITMTRTAEALPALAGGKVEVLASHILPSHFNIIARGGNVRIVADKGHHDPEGCTYEAIVATPALIASGRLGEAAGFEGLRVATEKSLSGYFYIDTLLTSLGVSPEVLHTFDLPLASKADGFRNGAIDFTTAAEPWLTRLLDGGDAVLWKAVEDFVPGFQSSVILYGPALLEGGRETGTRFLVGYLRGIRRYNEGKTERNVEIVAEATGLEPELVRKACWISMDGDGDIHEESLLGYQRWALRQGLVDRIVPVGEFWDPSFAGRAVEILRSREER